MHNDLFKDNNSRWTLDSVAIHPWPQIDFKTS